jgi:hypothetical protein
MTLPDAGGGRNPHPALDCLRRLAADLLQKGQARSAVFAELDRANRAKGLGVPAADLLALFQPAPAAPPDVNQETQENLSSQEQPGNTRESQREPPRRPPSGRTSAANPKTATEVFQHELENGLPSTLPFDVYLGKAVEEFGRWEEEGRNGGDWQSPLFYFVRLVKAHPALAQESAKEAFRKIEKNMEKWVTKGAPLPRAQMWERWLDISRDDAQAEFLSAWDKVRYLPGYAPLDNAIEQARRYPLAPRPEVADRRPDGYPMFVSIAGWLQVGMGDSNILLPVKELAPFLGVQPITISRYRKWAVEDGYLREVRPYRFAGTGKRGQATEFRFDVGRFQVLQDTAKDGTEEGFEQAG